MSVIINGDAGVTTTTGAVYNGIQRYATQTALGAQILFSDIPSWVSRVTVVLQNISLTSSGTVRIRLGTTAGLITTGYTAINSVLAASSVTTTTITDGIGTFATSSGSTLVSGQLVIMNIGSNNWVSNGIWNRNGDTSQNVNSGSIVLGASLTQLSLNTSGGFFSATFDSGNAVVYYE